MFLGDGMENPTLLDKKIFRQSGGWVFRIPAAFIKNGILDENETYDLVVQKHKDSEDKEIKKDLKNQA
jgi:hypothetical protein